MGLGLKLKLKFRSHYSEQIMISREYNFDATEVIFDK